jgi:hypothetical protein
LPSRLARPTQISRKRVRPAELTEHHRHELAPAGEAAGVPLGPRRDDDLLKLGARKEQQLAECSRIVS